MTNKVENDFRVQKQDDQQPGTSKDANFKDSRRKKPHRIRKQYFRISNESNQSTSDEKSIPSYRDTSRNRNIHQGPHRLRNSNDQNLRYKIYIRPKSQNPHQPSQLMKNVQIHPNRIHEIAKLHRKLSIISSSTDVTTKQKNSRHKHHHHHQHDVLYRPSHHLVYRRESLVEIKKGSRRSYRELYVQPSKAVLAFIKRRHRCQECLYSVSHCNCHLPEDISYEKKSDWAILAQRKIYEGFQEPQTWTRQRIGWLEEIEANTEYDLIKLHNEVAVEQEVCCFPFSTLGIFGKQKMESIDFYRKEPK